MTNHPCKDCPGRDFPSVYAKQLHDAQVHHRYEDEVEVERRTLDQLEKIGPRVLKLLMEHPETRNPKNWPLWTRYKQEYGAHILVYDEAHRGWMVNRPEGVMKADDLREFWAEIETVRRRRQDFQDADRMEYHFNPDGSPRQFVPLHACVLPTEKDEILAFEKQGVMRGYYGRRNR